MVSSNIKPKRICVLGAGPAGLSAARHSIDQGFQVICYDKCNSIGGQWVYTEPTGVKCETEIHSSIYEELCTSAPKEMMEYPDFAYPKSLRESFIRASEVLKYHQSYAEHFGLVPYIKLEHEVLRIRPHKGGWEVYVHNKVTNQLTVEQFDFVFVCNGRVVTPYYSPIKDADKYQGKRMHSHTYRRARDFKDETVLIIGAGRSGIDLMNHIRKFAKHVYLSHRVSPPPITDFMTNVTQKTVVENFTETGARFADGSTESFSVVIYCTGFTYTAPFLSSDCGLFIEENTVYPLYKHCISVNYPTMAFVGLHVHIFSSLHDLVARFALEFFSKRKTLPSREDMLRDTDAEIAEKKARGVTKRNMHDVHDDDNTYYNDLARIADITPIKQVILNIFGKDYTRYLYEIDTYRKSFYEIVDDEHFVIYPNKKAWEAKLDGRIYVEHKMVI